MENAYSLAMEIADNVMKDVVSELKIGHEYKDKSWQIIEKELLPLLNEKGKKLKALHENIFKKAFETLSKKSPATSE